MSSEATTCELCGQQCQSHKNCEVMDGYICSQCRSKLSPWVGGLDITETEDLEHQIMVRERNFSKIPDFHPTRKFGNEVKVILDDTAKVFTVAKTQNLWQEKVDLIKFEDAIDCTVDCDKTKCPSGYLITCYLNITLDYDYMDSLMVPLHSTPFEVPAARSFLGIKGPDLSSIPQYDSYEKLAEQLDDIFSDCEEGHDSGANKVLPGEYITRGTDTPSQTASSSAQIGEVTVCPWCGSRTKVTDSFRCEQCGGNL